MTEKQPTPRLTLGGVELPPMQTNSFTFNISREMAIDFGHVEPNAEELEERKASHRRFLVDARAALAAYREATAALDAVADPTIRAVLDLHAPLVEHSITCNHCHNDTEMGDRVDWPCETVTVIAGVIGVPLPKMTVYPEYAEERPTDEYEWRPFVPVPPASWRDALGDAWDASFPDE